MWRDTQASGGREMLLWRTRRRLMTCGYLIACLALIPTFGLLAWSVCDGPSILAKFGITLPIPSVSLSDVYVAPFLVSFFIAVLQLYRLAYDLREQAILGDPEAMAPANGMTASERLPLPITLIWRQTASRRAWLTVGLLISLAIYGGLMAGIIASGLVGFLMSLQGFLFWALWSEFVAIALIFAVIPLVFMYALTRGPTGVVADALGVTAWRGRRARGVISWTDARLLEVTGIRGRRTHAASYTLYAQDGRSIRWATYGEGPRFRHGSILIDSAINDGEQRAAAIRELAEAHAGLTARTLSSVAASHTSKQAVVGNLLLSAESFSQGTSSGYLTVIVGLTAGVGVATLLERLTLSPALPLLCAATLALASLWSFCEIIAQTIRKPHWLSPVERPMWSLSPGLASATSAQVRQRRVRWRNWPLATRAALLLVGSAAGLTAITGALLNGTSGESAELTIGSLFWLALTLVFAVLRLRGQVSSQRVWLDANADGVRDLTAHNSRLIPWASVVALRFTWDKRAGYSYLATTTIGEELTWVSQSRFWRDDQPGAATFSTVPAVDGETFAAYIAAHTGLTPTQALIA